MVKVTVTKHFAERMIERNIKIDLVQQAKKAIKEKLCIHIFDCCIRPNYRKVISVDGIAVGVVFCPERMQFFLTTIYKHSSQTERKVYE